ncbi:toxin-antitoxin system YwqK family antitoxin [Flavobacterium sp. RNTU_13]|uniref:toxin-antitoxin system YwqK family antitoxin n=1 Tax=Flavobacterium sp. RNTU_13 TaxID=3375145 RepID=UPI00398610CD
MEKLRVRDEDLEFAGIDGGGIAMYTYQGKPFTGIIEDYFFENEEQLASETEYLDGYQQGIETTYHENGKIATHFTSSNNKLHGECKQWDEDGNLISHSFWHNGELFKKIK